MIASLLPRTVAVAETRTAHDPVGLRDGERVSLGHASPGRAREFAAGRACGRRALSALGLPPGEITRGADREPRWPAGVVGSITHTRGYCAAAVARADTVAAVGIDAERHAPLPAEVRAHIALGPEAEFLAERDGDGVCWDCLLFSAKESVFKAWFPLTRRWLGFDEAIVAFDPGAGAFTATLLVAGPLLCGRRLTAFPGRFRIAEGLALTAVAVPAGGWWPPAPPSP
ncbi:MAG: 4'-phosphopantetheinyl transferase family protein [Solirubrobacteraceae bacterium]